MHRLDGISMHRAGRLAMCLAAASIAWPRPCPGGGPSCADGPSPRAEGAGESVGTRRALIVCGLPGDDEHRKLFADSVEKLRKALGERCGFAASEILVRSGIEGPPGGRPEPAGASGSSSREGISSGVAELRRRLTPDDTLWVIVLGHGHYDGRHSHLNIPGPDLDEREFARLFEGLRAREQVFWITTSASGFFLKPLSGPGRIVITATEPDQEVNETLFSLALADALASPPEGIDRDKDGQVSVLELYLAVVADVMKRYVDAEDLPTEHARLDDNGDGRGSELQERYLPPELGGRPGPGPALELKPDADGARASKARVAASPASRP